MEVLVEGVVACLIDSNCECGCYEVCNCDSQTCLCDNKGGDGCAKY